MNVGRRRIVTRRIGRRIGTSFDSKLSALWAARMNLVILLGPDLAQGTHALAQCGVPTDSNPSFVDIGCGTVCLVDN